MKTYTQAELNKILRNHNHWLLADCDGWENMRANLTGADLSGAKNVPFIPMTCPDSGSFTAWKKAGGKIVKLLVPEDAKRNSATGRKCRCNKAVVLAIENIDGTDSGRTSVASDYDCKFLYTINETLAALLRRFCCSYGWSYECSECPIGELCNDTFRTEKGWFDWLENEAEE